MALRLSLSVLLSVCCIATAFETDLLKGSAVATDGATVSGSEFLSLVDLARRSLGEVPGQKQADAILQTLPMLYNGSWNGFLEGPTWQGYWTQNSYGTAMTTLPFLSDVSFHAMRESQNWWFNNMADGTNPQGPHASQGWAPDGTSCDKSGPHQCSYKQGDGNVPIHDWALEETVSALVMQAELLLISRNVSAIEHHLPLFLRTSNLIEGRRDPATAMKMFLSGPSSNLLAPSFGAWPLDNGKHAWSYLTGLSVTYSAALLRMIECAKLAGDTRLGTLFSQRLALNMKGLDEYLAPSKNYFVRSVDPNGTLHGVVGQARHGYFEASPNHDAVAFGVVNMSMSRKIVAHIKSLGDLIRPNVFILPNTDSLGRPSRSGAGGIGYDDMECGDGPKCRGIFEFGAWVNGGVWTTTEGRWLLAAARTGDIEPAIASFRHMLKQFASTWRMDNPLKDFGRSPWEGGNPVNLVVDNFASAGGLLRGLFEYNYNSSSLHLVPHLPDSAVQFSQKFGIRWGPYSILLSSSGVCSSGVVAVRLNGIDVAQPHAFDSESITLEYSAMPTASAASVAAMNSSVNTAKTAVTLDIVFKEQHTAEELEGVVHDAVDEQAAGASFPRSGQHHDCAGLNSTHGLPATKADRLARFLALTSSSEELRNTHMYAMAALASAYSSAFEARCNGLNNGSIAPLRSFTAEEGSLTLTLGTAVSLEGGVENNMLNTVARSSEPVAKLLLAAWEPSADAGILYV